MGVNMDFLKPEVVALIVGVVGITEATKKAGLKWPTVLTSLALSIVAGIVGASPLTWQTGATMAFIVYGGATLAYEIVLKRFSAGEK